MESQTEATGYSTRKNTFWERITRYWWQLSLIVLLVLFVDIALFFASNNHICFYYAGLVMDWITVLTVITFGVITVATIVRHFKMKYYWQAFSCLLGSLLGLVVFFVWLFIYGMAAQSSLSYYAEHHPIPSDLEYNIPEYSFWNEPLPNRDSTVTESDTNSWLILYGGLGAYDWDFYYPALPDGILYLRLFEVTENEPLSYEQIKRRTETYVANHNAFGHIEHNQGTGFTIYEGDFEHYYAARVEVWHRDTSTQQERKLIEKIYRVDGWMR